MKIVQQYLFIFEGVNDTETSMDGVNELEDSDDIDIYLSGENITTTMATKSARVSTTRRQARTMTTNR